jgi:hypothetical protein
VAAGDTCAAADEARDRVSERTLAGDGSHTTAAWQRGLRDTGFVESMNLAIECRSADVQYGPLPALPAELVSRPVDPILATIIPSVFVVGVDPVAASLRVSTGPPRR